MADNLNGINRTAAPRAIAYPDYRGFSRSSAVPRPEFLVARDSWGSVLAHPEEHPGGVDNEEQTQSQTQSKRAAAHGVPYPAEL